MRIVSSAPRNVRIMPLALGGAFALATACASAGAPPGGPERHEPPQIVAVSPDSGATNVKLKSVEIRFDEVVSDRPSGSGATTLNQIFLISPSDGDPQVGWHRSRITLRPRKGFRANTAYRITMLPGLADLRGNIRREGLSILFSTGPTFPTLGIIGIVFDWAAQKPANGAYIEATSLADTTLVYVAASDSAGQFDVGPLGPGTYRVRALIDANSNRTVDRGEKWDTVTTTIVNVRTPIELDAIERDTVAASFAHVTVDDSVTMHVEFNQPLDPRLALQPGLFRIQQRDSSELQIVSAQWAAAYDRSKQMADSVRADSVARARPDTSRAQRPPPAVLPAVPPANPTGARPAPPPPKPRALPPERTVVIKLSPATPLVRGATYVISARGIQNLVGKSTPVRFTFSVPRPTPPRDTTKRAPADTTRRPPGGRPPTGRPPLIR